MSDSYRPVIFRNTRRNMERLGFDENQIKFLLEEGSAWLASHRNAILTGVGDDIDGAYDSFIFQFIDGTGAWKLARKCKLDAEKEAHDMNRAMDLMNRHPVPAPEPDDDDAWEDDENDHRRIEYRPETVH